MKASVRIGSGPKQKLSNNDHHHQRSDFLKTHGEAIAAGLSGLLILLAWLSEGNLETFSVILYLTAYVIGGFAKAREGIVSLVSEKKLDVNLLMLLAAAGAAAIGYWAEGALLIFIFALSGALEEYSEGRSRRDLSALLSLKPETARILVNGEEREISIDRLSVGFRSGETGRTDSC